MLKIRLFKVGRKKQPFYKIVVTDKNNPSTGGRFIEEIGFYNPFSKECKVNEEKARNWIEIGAGFSDTINNLFIKKGIIKGKKVNVFSLSKKKKEELAKKEEQRRKKEEEVKAKEEEEVKEEASETGGEEVQESKETSKEPEKTKESTEGESEKEEAGKKEEEKKENDKEGSVEEKEKK